MSKVRDISGLANIIKTDANGNVTFVSGSTTLMSISSSGAVTSTGAIGGSNATTLATTGSNTFTGQQYVSNTKAPVNFTDTASLYTDGGLRVGKDAYVSGTLYLNNLTVYGTQSVNFITSSQLDISDNIITVNTSTPAIRFGGIAVRDSGSAGTGLTGSLLWDSQNNHWIYTNPSGSSYSGGMLISGPRNTGSMGDEQGTTFNALMKGMGGDHITSSGIFESGSNVGIGTSTPSDLLELSSTSSPRVKITNTTNSGNSGIYFNVKDSSSNALQGGVYYVPGTTTYLTLSGDNVASHLNVTRAGNIGIGTTSPTVISGFTSVCVNNTTTGGFFEAQQGGTVLTRFGGQSDLAFIDTVANIPFIIKTNSTERMRISSTGNVSIGTSGSVGKLDISTGGNTNIVISNDSTDTGYNIVSLNGTRTKGSYVGIAGGGPGDANLYLNSGLDVAIQTGASYTVRMRVMSTGLVGIGTSSPSTLLHINTAARTSGTNVNILTLSDTVTGVQTSGYGVRIVATSNNGSAVSAISFDADGGTNNDTSIALHTQSTAGALTERMRITRAGNVGIGTNNAAALLHVQGTSVSYGFIRIISTSDSSGESSMNIGRTNQTIEQRWTYGQGTNGIGDSLGWYTGGGNKATLTTAGVWSTTGGGTSDRRTKQDINYNFDNGIESILKLQPTKFKFKEAPDNQRRGFIAQDVLEVIPDLVLGDGEKEDGIYGLDYDGILALTVKAIQEQQAQINELKAQING